VKRRVVSSALLGRLLLSFIRQIQNMIAIAPSPNQSLPDPWVLTQMSLRGIVSSLDGSAHLIEF
jgi:hypothetical protein